MAMQKASLSALAAGSDGVSADSVTNPHKLTVTVSSSSNLCLVNKSGPAFPRFISRRRDCRMLTAAHLQRRAA